jgi:hypothetical protein
MKGGKGAGVGMMDEHGGNDGLCEGFWLGSEIVM